MRKAAADLEFEEAARLGDELKRLKLLDLEFANDVMTPAGEVVDANAQAGAGGGAGAVQEAAAVDRRAHRARPR